MKKVENLRIFAGILFGVLTISLIIFIFGNSSQTATVSSQSSGRVMKFLNMLCSFAGVRPFFTQEIVRFLAHFCEFGLLGVLSYITFFCCFLKKLKAVIFSSVLVTSVSIADEVVQLFSEGRAFQFSDILIDLGGAFLGVAATALIIMIVGFLKRKNTKVA